MSRRAPKVCGCRNHNGKPKQQHASREAALDQIVRWHLGRSGGVPHEAYRCPRREGVWHVRSIRS